MDMTTLDAVRIELAPGAQFVMPVILAVIMFAVALSVRVEDFKALREQPWQFAGAAGAQIIGLPLLTLGLVYLLNPLPSIALGMFVVASCPGGNVSNFLTHLARGDTAFSVSLTAISSLAAALLTPFSIMFWTALYPPTSQLVNEIEVEALPFVIRTTTLLAIPLLTGMLLAHRYPGVAKVLRPIFLVAGIIGLFFLVFGALVSNFSIFAMIAGSVLGLVILHNAAAFGLGAVSGYVLGFAAQRRRTLTFEVGIQNTGLGLIILLGQFQGLGGAAAVTAMWAVWHLFSGTALVGIYRGLDLHKRARSAKLAE